MPAERGHALGRLNEVTSRGGMVGIFGAFFLMSSLPDELSFEAGAAISCGTGTAWGALHRLALLGDQTIAVFGQGPVGLSATLLASQMGARVIALDTSEERLQRAVQVPVELYDERFTTRLASHTGGSASLDSRAAAVLLDEWLTVSGHLPIEGTTD